MVHIMNIKSGRTHESLEKALKILLSFTPDNREKTVAELSRELELTISTTSRLLKVLVSYGFILQDEWTNKFSLGKSSLDVGRALYQTIRERLISIAQPYVDQLRDSIGQDVGLEVLVDNSTMLVYRAWGPSELRSIFTMENRLPVHVSAGAKAILAFSPSGVVGKLLDGKLIKVTENTITNVKVLKTRLAKFRDTGFAYDFGENDIDHHFVAAPIFNHVGKPIAAVVTGNLAQKVQGKFDPKILSALKETATRISARLMHSASCEQLLRIKKKSK